MFMQCSAVLSPLKGCFNANKNSVNNSYQNHMFMMYMIPSSLNKLILITYQGYRHSLYLHFADEETEVQRRDIILSKVTHPVS